MASKTKPTATPATRGSSRSKTPASRPQLSRTTRAATKAKGISLPVDTSELPVSVNMPVRKPLWSRNNGIDSPAMTKRPLAPKMKFEATKATEAVQDVDHQPIKAFLRIRSRTSKEPASAPYLSPLSDTAVRMTDPSLPTSGLQTSSSQTIYTFSKVFPPETRQAEFFTSTTLPLVRDLLDGQNGLLFAYGVTNSGKTYTIQGGAGKGDAGLLPRTLDVVFNSIEGLQTDTPFRPTRLGGVELDEDGNSSAKASLGAFSASQNQVGLSPDIDQSILAGVIAEQIDPADKDETSLQVDRNYEFSVWVSYAEIYNEKVFDLLGSAYSDTVKPPSGGTPFCSNFAALANTQCSSADSNKPLLVRRKALSLKNDPDGGKYISGLREVRVRNVDEARAVIKMGQINRRVFGTLANHASSRSHGIFTVKLLRIHNGCPTDPDAVQTARLSIVDLAGSERANNTQNTGERLKEAGNINKSLMVLGQCMEALRINQKRLANAPSTRSLNVKLTLVPFRHSKLTELFQDFFVGNGKAVMIVNVNPYDTGFDENAHVMKFAALAKDVTTVQQRPPASGIPRLAANTNHRRVTLSIAAKTGARVTETHLEILEEDEEGDEEAPDSEPTNLLINALFEHVEELRIKLIEAEMRCAMIESEIREEVMKEMEERMTRMERMYTQRLRNELEENQFKIDRKIDMLQQAGLIGAHARQPSKHLEDLEEELDVEESLVIETDEEIDEEPSLAFSEADHTLMTATTSDIFHMENSPLAGKTNSSVVSRNIIQKDDINGPIGLFGEGSEEEAESSDCSSLDDTDEHSVNGRTASEGTSDASDSEWGPDSEGGNRSASSQDLDSPEQTSSQIATVKRCKNYTEKFSSSIFSESPLKHKSRGKNERLDHAVLRDFLGEPEANGADSIAVISSKQTRKAATRHSRPSAQHIPHSDKIVDVPKKKKRSLRKKAVVTEEEIDVVTNRIAKVGLNGGMVRRLAT